MAPSGAAEGEVFGEDHSCQCKPPGKKVCRFQDKEELLKEQQESLQRQLLQMRLGSVRLMLVFFFGFRWKASPLSAGRGSYGPYCFWASAGPPHITVVSIAKAAS